VSFGEIQQIYRMLKDIDELIRGIDVKTEELRANMGKARGEFREVEYILYRVTSLLNRMGLPPSIAQAIQKIEGMIMVTRMLHSTMILMESTTPYGWILGIISGVGAAVSGIDLTMETRK